MKLSQHARIRMQQRGIPRLAVDWLAAELEGEPEPTDWSVTLSPTSFTPGPVGKRTLVAITRSS